tara:strand:- start:1697 stop:2008 length:312 start_codon:yes stop_codon:yes gene_type:complete
MSWVEHVKAYATKNKVSYKDALKSAGASYTKATKTKEPKEKKAKESKEAKAPVKRKKKEEKKEEMPEIVGKGEKHDKLVVEHEKEKRMEAIKKVKGKASPLLK